MTRQSRVLLINRASLWFLCLGAFAFPLVYSRATHDEFVLPKLLFAQVLLVILVAIYALRCAAGGSIAFQRTPLDLPLLAFVTSAVVATVFAINRNVAFFGMYLRYEGLLTLLTYAGLFWLTAQIVRGGDRARTLIRSMIASAYVVSLIAVLQWVVAELTTTPVGGETGFSFGGLPRASATMSNPTMLAAFVAMLLPLAVRELFDSSSLAGRILAANTIAMMSLALTLTFVRSAWLGALGGVAIAVLAPQRTALVVRLALSAAAGVAVVALVVIGSSARGGTPLIPSLIQRAASITSSQGSESARIQIWTGTLPLVASRPLVGYGPDTFGMVFPRYRTGDPTPGLIVDKAHNELLEIASTQGLLGAFCYLWLLGAIAVAFWRSRRQPGAAAALGGVVAYQVWAQANFSWVPAAVPYWLFLAAAVATWTGELPTVHVWLLRRTAPLMLTALFAVAAIALAAIGAARAWSADVHYETGLVAEGRGDVVVARAELAESRALDPEQSQYALEAGKVALRSNDWTAARQAFTDAARLGTFYSAVYYDLALTDVQLGRRTEAIEALHHALELSPADPASLDLLRQLNGT